MAFDILLRDGGTGVKDFLSALVKPLQTNTDSLSDFETEYGKRSRFNGQKIVLQAALNDIFGITNAPYIYIENTTSIGEILYFYEDSETQPVYFSEDSEDDDVLVYEDSELPASNYDFIVYIPSGIYTAELERRVRAEVNLYKVIGTRFTIDTY